MTTPLTLVDIAEKKPNKIHRAIRRIVYGTQPKTRLQQVVRGGIRYQLYYDAPDRQIIKNGSWEREQIVYFFNHARDFGATIFLDIGANFGYYSLLAAKLDLFSQIHAFEPQPHTYARLLWHIQNNGWDNIITPHNMGVSDHQGEMYMQDIKMANGEAQLLNKQDDSTIAVGITTLDSLFDFCDQKIAIKMDVENHEVSAINGALRLFSQNHIFLQLEVHSDNTETIHLLLANNFKLIYYTGIDFYFTQEKPPIK